MGNLPDSPSSAQGFLSLLDISQRDFSCTKSDFAKGCEESTSVKLTPDPQGVYNPAGQISCTANTPGRPVKHDRRLGKGLEGRVFTERDHLEVEACQGRL